MKYMIVSQRRGYLSSDQKFLTKDTCKGGMQSESLRAAKSLYEIGQSVRYLQTVYMKPKL